MKKKSTKVIKRNLLGSKKEKNNKKKDISNIAKKTYLGKKFKINSKEEIKSKIKKQDEDIKKVVLSDEMQKFKGKIENDSKKKMRSNDNGIDRKETIKNKSSGPNAIKFAIRSTADRKIKTSHKLNVNQKKLKSKPKEQNSKLNNFKNKKLFTTNKVKSRKTMNNNGLILGQSRSVSLNKYKKINLIAPKIKSNSISKPKKNNLKENIKKLKFKDNQAISELKEKEINYLRNNLSEIEEDLDSRPVNDISSATSIKSIQISKNIANTKKALTRIKNQKEIVREDLKIEKQRTFNRFETSIYNISDDNTLNNKNLKKELLKKYKQKTTINKINEKIQEETKHKVSNISKKLINKFKEGRTIKIAIPFLIILMFGSMFSGAGGSVASPPSQMIMTTEEDNNYYLDKYKSIKQRLQIELDTEIENAEYELEKEKVDKIEHIGHDGVIEDINFIEFMSFLAVIKQQDFEQSKDDDIIENLYSKMVKLHSRIEYEQTKDTTIKIRVIEVKYFDYKLIMEEVAEEYKFKNKDDEWVENLVESAMFVYPITNMPGNFNGDIPELNEEDIQKYGGYFHPLNGGGRVSSEMGYRIHPITGNRKLHAGIDIGVAEGTPVYSAKDGVVIFAGWQNPANKKAGYGLYIVIQHNDGTKTLYAHNSSLSLQGH